MRTRNTSTWCCFSPIVLILRSFGKCSCKCLSGELCVRVCSLFSLNHQSHTFLHGWISTLLECFLSLEQRLKQLQGTFIFFVGGQKLQVFPWAPPPHVVKIVIWLVAGILSNPTILSICWITDQGWLVLCSVTVPFCSFLLFVQFFSFSLCLSCPNISHYNKIKMSKISCCFLLTG